MDVIPAQKNVEIPSFQLKRLKPKHKQVAALLAQGLGREEIAQITGITPQYVTMLAQQPLFMAYIEELTAAADMQLQALYGKGVQVLGEVLVAGSHSDKLRATQMVMRAVGKEGSLKVQGTMHHKHSLVGILQSLPPAGAMPGRDVPILNVTDDRDAKILAK